MITWPRGKDVPAGHYLLVMLDVLVDSGCESFCFLEKGPIQKQVMCQAFLGFSSLLILPCLCNVCFLIS